MSNSQNGRFPPCSLPFLRTQPRRNGIFIPPRVTSEDLERCKHRSKKCAIVGAGAFVHTTSEDIPPKYSKGNAGDDSEKQQLQENSAAKKEQN
jgi:hypothetical protein